MTALTFELLHRSTQTHARLGRVYTPHGSFDTPAFMPVGTRGSVKGITPEQVEATGSQILLNNAFHLMLRPGDDLVARRGGVHAFMRWPRPILTDSGGYQAFSLADARDIRDDGVTFASIIDGSRIHLTPARAIDVQNNLGADIIMAFDDCPPPQADPRSPEGAARLQQAVERTTRWLDECIRAHRRSADQALFGIVQGGANLELRERSLRQVTAFDLPGYAVGGVAVGEAPELIHSVVAHTAPQLPADRPRYLMGVGYECDIVAAVQSGIDMFDCVLPTRNGRNGNVFTRTGRLRLRNAVHMEDDGVIDAMCDCSACAGGFSRAYLRHLFMAGEMLGPILASLHNIRHFQRLMLDIRRAIRDDAWSFLQEAWPVLQTGRDAGVHAGTADPDKE